MKSYSLSHVQDSILLRDLAAIVARDHATTATLLAHIAEVDARRLYAGEGYSSMFVYCLDELHLSEDAAYKRIQAARAGRQFPALFHALEEGRLHLAAICLLAPHLTPENVEDLIEAATRRRKSEIEHLLAQRFPELGAPPVRALIRALPVRPIPAPTIDPLGQVDAFHTTDDDAVPSAVPESQGLLATSPCRYELSERSTQLAPGQVEHRAASATAPPERFLVRVTIEKTTHDKLRHAQALLSHAVPSGDVAQVLDRALDMLIEHLEKRLGVRR